MRTRRKIALRVGMLMLVAYASFASTGRFSPSVATALAFGSASAPDDTHCALTCYEPYPNMCESGQHDAYVADPPSLWNGKLGHGAGIHLVTACQASTCDSTHSPSCTPYTDGVNAIDALASSLKNGDAARVSHILSQLPERVVLNDKRGAIQVTNCMGLLIAHLPVTSDLARQIHALNQ